MALEKELVWKEENSDEILFLVTFGWVEGLMERQGGNIWDIARAADLQFSREIKARKDWRLIDIFIYSISSLWALLWLTEMGYLTCWHYFQHMTELQNWWWEIINCSSIVCFCTCLPRSSLLSDFLIISLHSLLLTGHGNYFQKEIWGTIEKGGNSW